VVRNSRTGAGAGGAPAATTTTVVDVATRGVTQRFIYLRPDAPVAIDARQGVPRARALVWVTGKRCAEQWRQGKANGGNPCKFACAC